MVLTSLGETPCVGQSVKYSLHTEPDNCSPLGTFLYKKHQSGLLLFILGRLCVFQLDEMHDEHSRVCIWSGAVPEPKIARTVLLIEALWQRDSVLTLAKQGCNSYCGAVIAHQFLWSQLSDLSSLKCLQKCIIITSHQSKKASIFRNCFNAVNSISDTICRKHAVGFLTHTHMNT